MMGHSKREGFNDQLGPVAPVNLLFLTCFLSRQHCGMKMERLKPRDLSSLYAC